MPSMSYCVFENTYGDLMECYDRIDRKDLSESEAMYRERLIKMCRLIADEFPADDPAPAAQEAK